MSKPEKNIVNKILDYLNDLPHTYAHKVYSGGYAQAGEPDVDSVCNGHSLKLEVKVPGEWPTPLQQVRLDQWADAGAIAACVHSVEEVATLVETFCLENVR